jgi:threonine/homoserine/homoserine lactone efflux protein
MFEYYTLGLIALLAAISPGPDFAIVLRNALTHHQRAGIFTALGISAGILVHTSYCVLGLALIISQSILLFNIIKFVGAGYIIWELWVFFPKSRKIYTKLKRKKSLLFRINAHFSMDLSQMCLIQNARSSCFLFLP